VSAINEKFPGVLLSSTQPNPFRLFLTVDREDIKDVADYLFNTVGARLILSSGTDKSPINGTYEVSYLFSLDRDNLIVALKEVIDPADPWVPSLTNIIPGADWHEREMRDLMGIVPEGHPDPRRLVVADDWPEDVFPLRKDVPYNFRPPRVTEMKPPMREPKEHEKQATILSIGPFFPTLEEPAYFRLYVEGEQIVGSDYRGFFAHRGIEKLTETVLEYNQVPFIAERICGICGFVHSATYCMAVEEAAGIEVPPRAKYIRSIMLELERVHSHLLWIGLAAHYLGFDTVLMQAWRIREPVMWLTEQITGNRKTYGMNLVGGVRRDIDTETAKKILDTIGKIEAETKELISAAVEDNSLKMRLEKVGTLTKEDARKICVVGPTARASGLAIDARQDRPYLAYPDLDFKIAVQEGCDIWARTLVRAEETFTAISLIRQMIEKMPAGELMAEVGPIPPWREGIAAVEAPRGECCHYVITGPDNRPYRWRVRASTYPQLQSIPRMLDNMSIADFPIIVGSIDPCFSCTERLITVDTKSRKVRTYTKQELLAMSRRNSGRGSRS
ncbi:MAG: NADH-ubiquinone oxidoreductase, partial [Acidobacteria bacterium]|nr:NADH-ubiquinone oxidoreductase [Acidobacteriota bacterium]